MQSMYIFKVHFLQFLSHSIADYMVEINYNKLSVLVLWHFGIMYEL